MVAPCLGDSKRARVRAPVLAIAEGCESRPLNSVGRSQAGVKDIAQAVADEVPTDGEEDNGYAGGKVRIPVLEGIGRRPDNPIAGDVQHHSPIGQASIAGEAEESKHGCQYDHRADVRGSEHKEALKHIGQDVPEDDAPTRRA